MKENQFIFQIIRIGVIVREWNKRHLSEFMLIFCGKIAGIRHHERIVVEQPIIQGIAALPSE